MNLDLQFSFPVCAQVHILMSTGYTGGLYYSAYQYKDDQLSIFGDINILTQKSELRIQPISKSNLFFSAGFQVRQIDVDNVSFHFDNDIVLLNDKTAQWDLGNFIGIGIKIPIKQLGIIETSGMLGNSKEGIIPYWGMKYIYSFGLEKMMKSDIKRGLPL